jgi:hypothetical protein
MKTLFALPIGLLAATAAAQTPIMFHANCQPYLVVNAAKDTTVDPVGRNYNWLHANPAEYDYLNTGALGIAPGTRNVRWIPSMFNNCLEEQEIGGFQISARPSVRTATFPMTGYAYELQIHQPLQLKPGADFAQGQQFGADFSKPAVMTLAQASLTLTGFGNWVSTITLTTPVKVTQREIVMSAKYDANGQTTAIKELNPNHQALFNSYADQAPPAGQETYGFAAPTTNVMTYVNAAFGLPWLKYRRLEPTLNPDGDWGYQRLTAAGLIGSSPATCMADLGTTAGKIGWRVDGGTGRAGDICMFLFNVGPVQPVGLPIAGETFEVNIADPFLTWLSSSLGTPKLDTLGVHNTALLSVPALGPGAVGAIFGVEVLLVKSDLSGFDGTSQSNWFRINK